ncbi:MAG: enoyl-CoA hydratase/isomerase family protein [Oligoflexia bacterium]|nr:enoyl-CoA hydratase/isomerase family protein [Oligoflexia bacterium]
MTEQGKVTSTLDQGITTITFSHPRSNSMPGALLRALAAEIDRAGADKQSRVIVLSSEGEKIFCAGASFDEMKTIKSVEQGLQFFSGFATVILAMRRCPKFIVARIQGKAAGGGVGILSACDYVFAHSSASVRLSELAIGIGPFIIGPAVQRKVGLAAFTEMAISADWRDAQWAKSHGLFVECFATHKELDTAVSEFAAKLAGCSAEAMAKLKGVLWEGTEHWEDLLIRRARFTSDLVLSDFVQTTISKM